MGMNCKKAAYYLAKQEEKKLGLWERILLVTHLLHCGWCRKFKHQLERITRAAKAWTPHEKLTPEEKELLKNSISKNL